MRRSRAREPQRPNAERRGPSAASAVANHALGLRLLAVWLTAFGLRCLYLWQVSVAPFYPLRIGDAEAYHLWAGRIAAGDWLGHDVFYQSPLYPYFLALLYKALGDSVTVVRLIQAGIGATSCAVLALAGRRLLGRGGELAGFLLAIYPPAIFLDGLLDKSSLVTFFTCALIAFLASPHRSHTRWIATGIMLGLLTLTRENALLLAVPILGWLWIGPSDVAPNKRTAALAFAGGCAIVLLPIAARNLAVSGEVVLTTSQFGPNFYIGNHAGATGTYEPLVVGHGSAADEQQDAARLAEEASGRALTPAEVSAFWTRRALQDIRSHPGDWVALLGRKLALTFNASEAADTESQSVYAEWSPLLRALTPFTFGVLFAIAVIGIVLTTASWSRSWFLCALAGTYAVSVMGFYVFARYRFPLVPFLAIPAAAAVLAVRARRTSPRALATAVVVASVAAAFSHLPLENEHAARAAHYFDIGATLARDAGRREQAMDFYMRALQEAPGFPAAESGVATLLASTGRVADAIPHYRSALAAWPADAEVRYNLGLALAKSGQVEEATGQFAEALRLRPGDADIHVAMGNVLLTRNRAELAAEHYRQALALQPKYIRAIVGLGVALAQLGRADEAIAEYAIALGLDPGNAEAHNNLGGTLANQGRIAEALPHFERAVELDPHDEAAKENLRRARLAQESTKGR
jgi:Flp pilus assembly protein TadD